jgi:hypothetical protein
MVTFRNWNDPAGRICRLGESGVLDYFELASNIADDHHVSSVAMVVYCSCFCIALKKQSSSFMIGVHDLLLLITLTTLQTITCLLLLTEQPTQLAEPKLVNISSGLMNALKTVERIIRERT